MNENTKNGYFSQGVYQESATRKERVGALRILEDGRKFRYCKNGAVALTAGLPIMGPLVVAHHINCAVAASAAIGSTELSVTIGATALTTDQYKDGYIQVNDATGEGLQYRIDSHGVSAAGSEAVTVTLKDPIHVALTVSVSEVSFIPNPFSGVLVATGAAVFPAGIPPIAVTANYYFWSQTGGLGCAYVTNAVAIGQKLTAGNGLLALAAAHDSPVVGISFAAAGVTTEFKPVWLTLD